MCVVLANGYAGTLFSFLSVSKLEQPINSLEELANSKDVQLLVQFKTEVADRFMVNTIINIYNQIVAYNLKLSYLVSN